MILGSSVRNHIRSFGFSLSGGVDLDSNEYDQIDDQNDNIGNYDDVDHHHDGMITMTMTMMIDHYHDET